MMRLFWTNESSLSFIKVSDYTKLILKNIWYVKLLLFWVPTNNCSELRTRFLAKIHRRTLERDRQSLHVLCLYCTVIIQTTHTDTSMKNYPCSELHLNPPYHSHSSPNLCMRAFFHVYKAIWEQSVFFLPTPTALSLNPLIFGCEILPSISSILNDFLTPLAILFTFLHFLSSPLHQGVHLEGTKRDFTWHSSHYDHDVTSRLAQALLQMQKISAILIAGFLIQI